MKNNQTKYALLGLLNHEPMSGYAIKQRVDQALGFFWNTGFGQIYPALKTMKEDDWVTVMTEASDTGPDRQIYSITELGRSALVEWLKEPVEKEHVRYEILLKLFFSGAVGKENAITNIDAFLERNKPYHTMMSLFLKNLESVLDESEDHMYYYLTALFGEKVYAAYIEWANEAKTYLEKK